MKKISLFLMIMLLFGTTTVLADTIYSQDFELRQPGTWISGYSYPRGHVIDTIEETKGGNRYGAVQLNMATNAGTPYSDIMISSEYVGDYITFESSVMVKNSNGLGSSYIFLYDETGQYTAPIKITGYKLYTGNGGTQVMDMEEGVFYHVAVVMNMKKRTYSVFIDDEEVATKVSLGSFTGKSLARFRLQVQDLKSGVSDIHFGVDNVYIHNGSAPLTKDEKESNSSKGAMDIVKIRERVKNVMFFYDNAYKAFIDAKIEEMPAKCYTKNNEFYIPLRYIVEKLDGTVGYDAQTGKITASIGKKTITSADYGIVNNDGMAFITANALAELVGKNCQFDRMGYAVIGDKSEFYDWDGESLVIYGTIKQLINELPDGYEVVADVIQKHQGQHPRVFATEDQLQIIRDAIARGDQPVTGWWEAIKRRCDNELTKECIDFKMNDAVRAAGAVQDVQYIIVRYALAYGITGEKKYADRGIAELLNFCDFEAWPDWNQYHMLEVGEGAYGAGIGYDMFYNVMTEEQRKQVRDGIKQSAYQHYRNDILEISYSKGLGKRTDDPLDRSYAWRLMDMRHNWTMIIDGGMAVAALAICDDEDSRAESEEILGYVIEDIQDVFYGYLPDGAWYEGTGYWGYMTKYFAGMIRGFETSCGTDYGIGDNPGVNLSGEFLYAIQGPGGSFNFSDAQPGYVTGGDAIFHMTERYNNAALFDIAERFINNHANKVYPEQVRDYALAKSHFDKEKAETEEMPLDGYWRRIETVMMRDSWDDSVANLVGLHGGRNNDTHAQMDSGTIIIDGLGKRFVSDLGQDDYNISGGHLKYRNNPMGHNLLCFNPTTAGQGQQTNGVANIIRQESNKVDSIAVVDLKDVWGGFVNEYKRGVRLTDERNVIIVQDEFDITEYTNELWWFIHTPGTINLSEDKRSATITINNIQMEVIILTDNEGEFEIMEPVGLPGSQTAALTGQSVIKDITKLGFNFKNVESGTFAVAFVPKRIGMPNLRNIPEVQPIDEWTLADDSYYVESEKATLEQIYIDGKPIENFRSDVSSYSSVLPFGSKEIPVVTVNEQDAVIYPSKTLEDPTYIIVGEGSSENIYSVTFTREVATEGPNGLKEIPFASITVSDEPQPANCASNMWDNNYDTRWSAQAPCYADYDLGEKRPIDAVGLSWYLGEERQADIEIFISDDGIEWTRVFSGLSTGLTNELEYYDVGGVEARYVRVKGYKTSASAWVSITEFKVFELNK